jgi:hypothetical protein
MAINANSIHTYAYKSAIQFSVTTPEIKQVCNLIPTLLMTEDFCV